MVKVAPGSPFTDAQMSFGWLETISCLILIYLGLSEIAVLYLMGVADLYSANSRPE